MFSLRNVYRPDFPGRRGSAGCPDLHKGRGTKAANISVLELAICQKHCRCAPRGAPLRRFSKDREPKLSCFHVAAYIQPLDHLGWFGAQRLASTTPSPSQLSPNPADLAGSPLLLALPASPAASSPPRLPEALPPPARAAGRLLDVQRV